MTRAARTSLLRVVAWSALVLAGAVLTLVVGAAPASAHNVLTGTTPKDGADLARVPAAVELTFDQPAIAMGTELIVTGPTGPVQVGPPRLVDTTITQDLQGGSPAGTYTVAWRVTSADGHPIDGAFTFTAAHASTGTPRPVPTSTPTPHTEAAGAGMAALAAGIGLAAVAAVAVMVRRRHRTADDTDPYPDEDHL